ncbi:MAG TPA: class II aldolase/adducin family protein [Kofleriaceae bacterium]|nr:class II aldolase/adducin family protein [Kofleriaceae bacterium]
MKAARATRTAVAAAARDLHARGWVANHDGNISVRDGNSYVATPTATSKRLITDANVIELDAAGRVLGQGKVFGEIGLHLAVYERRPDVAAVVHAHPPHATALACSGRNLIDEPFIAEAVVSLGARIPLVEYAQPGDAAKKALGPWCEQVDAVLLGNHGVLTWGADLEQALMRMELVEHLARIALAAAPIGGVRTLPEGALAPLLAARAKAGLGRAADRAVESFSEIRSSTKLAPGAPVAACAPAPHAAVATIGLGGGSKAPPLADLIREEIVRALSKS